MFTPTPQSKIPGRPKSEIDLSRVRDLAALGLSAEQVADRLGVCRRTLFNRMACDPTIRAAMDEGLSEATEFCARTLLDMAREKNLGALIFFLKTRGGFHVPKNAQPAPTVTLNFATQAALSLDRASQLAEEQGRVLEMREAELSDAG